MGYSPGSHKESDMTKRLSTHTASSVQFSSVAQLCPTLRPRESQHVRPPCPSPTPGFQYPIILLFHTVHGVDK